MKNFKILALSLFIIPQIIFGQQDLVFTSLTNQEVARVFLKEAYSRIDIKISFIIMPGERAIRESNAGNFDGESTRIEGLEKKYKNLIPVPFQLGRVSINIYVIDKIITDSIPLNKLKEYRFGIIKGYKSSEILQSYGDPVTVTKSEQLLFMLQADRLDFIVLDATEYKSLKQREPLANSLVQIQPPILTFDHYHYIHKKHKSLIPELVITFKEMVEDGTYIKILKQYKLDKSISLPSINK